MLQFTNDCYRNYLSRLAVLANTKERSHKEWRVLRRHIYKKVTFEDDPEVNQAYYRILDDHAFNSSFTIEAVAWDIGEAYADLEELYNRSQ
jgi:hypothetical protein